MAGRPSTLDRGATSFTGGVGLGKDVWMIQGAGAPTSGTSGTGVGRCGKGSQYTDRTNAKLYINTGTKASPTWTVVGTQS